MLMSDLLHADVVTAEGDRLGSVHDLRVERDGPYVEGFGNAIRVTGLVVGRGGAAVRLGYVRHGVRGPALLRWWARRAERRAALVPWESVDRVDDGVVRLRPGWRPAP